MLIIGCDYHLSFRQFAWVDSGTGEFGEQLLIHGREEAEEFFRSLSMQGVPARVGMEATGRARWFERLLVEPNLELWFGDPTQVRAARVRKQKTDRCDVEHILKLISENRFPREWTPGPENSDWRQLLSHRHRLVQTRTWVTNQLRATAMNEGIQRKQGLWSQKGRAQLESLQLPPWATRGRQDLLELGDRVSPTIDEFCRVIEEEAHQRVEVQLLTTHPGLGPLTALAYVLIIGTPGWFRSGKQMGSHFGFIPFEDSSAGHQRLGHISKQGNSPFHVTTEGHTLFDELLTWSRIFGYPPRSIFFQGYPN
jgi:transposase